MQTKSKIILGVIIILLLLVASAVYLIYPYLPNYGGELGTVIINHDINDALPGLTFTNPLGFQFSPDNSSHVYVVEQGGIIYLIKGLSTQNPTKQVFIDVSDLITSGGERGLLGFVFDPDFANNGFFYLDYTVPNPLRTQIVRFQVNLDNFETVDISTKLVILEVGQPYPNHNAGDIAFGLDGMLYITMGDGGNANDPHNHGQDLTTLLGTILRIDVSSSSQSNPYEIPLDNPFVGNPHGYQEEIWAYGLRNPWKMSFDPVNGDLWTGDVGQNRYEEVNLIEKGGNYGWNYKEGFECFNRSSCEGEFIDPIYAYSHSEGGISVIGGYVYRGNVLTDLYGHYIFGDYVSGKFWHTNFNNNTGQYETEMFMQQELVISSFGIDSDGNIYICSFDGHIYKIIPVN
jgi:glucose/arabinose dehydrogenase